VTIDGPAGSGKTTVSRLLAAELGCIYVDTGALYRGVAVAATDAGVSPEDPEGLARLLDGLTLELVPGPEANRVIINGQDITDRLRTPEVTMAASAASAHPVVRQWLLDTQRSLGKNNDAVFEGRDMGTVVFPHAPFKFFLVADPKVRAKRRFLELSQKGGAPPLEEVEADMARRDENDSTRATAPLRKPDGAVAIDSTSMTPEQVVAVMARHVRKHLGDVQGKL